eukprot:g9053.t1
MTDEKQEHEKTCRRLLVPLDYINYFIEFARDWTIDPTVAFVNACITILRDKFVSKQVPKTLESKGSKEDVYKAKDGFKRSRKEEDIKYCLHSSKLSFFAPIISVNGIPAFLMTQDSSVKGTEHQQGFSRVGPSRTYAELLKSSETATQAGEKVSDEIQAVNLESIKSDLKGPNPFSQRTTRPVTKCGFSLDSTRFAVSYASGDVAIWDSDHGTLIKKKNDRCHSNYKCWKWNIDGGNDLELTEFLDAEKLSKIEGEVLSQRSDFFANGTKLVLSTLASCSEGRKLSIVLVDTTLENPMSIEPSYFPLSLKENFVVSQVSMSPDKEGLLVGLTEEGMEESYCMVWPDFITKPDLHRKLDIGTMGSWSHDNKYVVTWTMIGMSSLEDINRSSAFIWSIQKIKENPNNHEYKFEYQLTSPFKEQVFWCQITKYEKEKEKNRLIMGIIGETTRFLFWDLDTKIHTHSIETRNSTKDMILGNDEAWTESHMNRKTVKGLSPMDMTENSAFFGAVLGWPSSVLIWDTILGVKVLKISLKDIQDNHRFKGGINLMASPSSEKFAIIGSEEAMVFCPSIPNGYKNRDKHVLEAQMVELKNKCGKSIKDSSYKMKFSGDGNTLGVLCIGSSKMQLWNLPQGTDCKIDAADLDEGNINDFCLSYNGEHLAACTDNNILVWKYEAKTMQPIGRIKINSEVVDMGIKDDGSKIVLCMKNGSIHICWTTVAEKASNVDTENDTTSYTPSREANIKQKHPRPMTDLEYPLISHGSVTSQTPPESNGHKLTVLVQYHYEMSDLVGECEQAKFQVSPKFERVIRISHPHTIEVWNLETEEKVENVDVDEENITKSSDSYSRVSSINKKVSRRLQNRLGTHLVGTSITLTKQTTVVQSSKKHIVVAANAPSSGLRHRTNLLSYDVEYVEESHEDSHSVYIVNLQDEKLRRRLSGKDLNPGRGLAISEDGRHVACFAGVHASEIFVWNVYASENLLPDYHFLALNRATQSKEAIKKEIGNMMSKFGINFFKFRHPSGMSVLDEAIWFLDNSFTRAILDYAAKDKIKVSFLCPSNPVVHLPMEKYGNIIENSIAARSPKTLKIALKYLLERVTQEAEISTILKQSLVHILQEYPQVFERVIRDPRILGSRHEIRVPENSLDDCQFITFTDDDLNLSTEKTKSFWKEKLKKDYEQSRVSLITVIAGSVPYEGICDIGKTGLLHNLFIYGAHHLAFASFIVKAVVQYKWKTYAQKLLIQELFCHSLISICFTVYCFFLSADRTYMLNSDDDDDEHTKISTHTSVALLVCWVLATPCLIREICQCQVYISDHGFFGFCYWLKSAWNWIEVLCYIILVFIIPLGQYFFLTKGEDTFSLSAFVAVESLLIWSRMLFYARPFRHTGPLVIIISAIIQEIVYFLALALAVIFGFALAFYVLYRHVESPKEVTTEENALYYRNSDEHSDDDLRTMHQAFGTFKRSFFTVFKYTYGDIDLESLYNAPEPVTALGLLIAYVIIIALILINMLIALMSEKFSRIYKHRRTRFTEARARAIDDIDSMLSSIKNRYWSGQIKKYLQIAIPSHLCKKMLEGSRIELSQTRQTKEINKQIKNLLRRRAIRKPPANPTSFPRPGGRSLVMSGTLAQSNRSLASISEVDHQQPVPVETAEEPEHWYESDSTDSEFSVRHSDEESD